MFPRSWLRWAFRLHCLGAADPWWNWRFCLFEHPMIDDDCVIPKWHHTTTRLNGGQGSPFDPSGGKVYTTWSFRTCCGVWSFYRHVFLDRLTMFDMCALTGCLATSTAQELLVPNLPNVGLGPWMNGLVSRAWNLRMLDESDLGENWEEVMPWGVARTDVGYYWIVYDCVRPHLVLHNRCCGQESAFALLVSIKRKETSEQRYRRADWCICLYLVLRKQQPGSSNRIVGQHWLSPLVLQVPWRYNQDRSNGLKPGWNISNRIGV